MTINGTSAAQRVPRPDALGASAPGRIDWVDYAKGICIVMVVMMHSVLGVEKAADQTGFMHALVAFAKPFRMPDFFLISGLFLSVVIDRDWRTYLDRKVVHFAYFYLLWVTIQFGFKAPSLCRRERLEPCRPHLSGILHRAVRHAVVHLSAAGVFRCHKTDTPHSAARDLGGGSRARDGAYRDRLDRDRRILRALRLFLFRLSVRQPVFALSDRARARPVSRSRGWRCGRSSMAAWSNPVSANGRWFRSRSGSPAPAPSSSWARCWRACSGSISCAIAASIPSSSISPSSCRWPRRGRCCCGRA